MSDLDVRLRQFREGTANRRLLEIAVDDEDVWFTVRRSLNPDTASHQVFVGMVRLVRDYWDAMPKQMDVGSWERPERPEYVELEWFTPPSGVLVDVQDDYPVTFNAYRIYKESE